MGDMYPKHVSNHMVRRNKSIPAPHYSMTIVIYQYFSGEEFSSEDACFARRRACLHSWLKL